VRGFFENSMPDSLLLIGRREPRSSNSWLHNSPRLAKGPNRCTLSMHGRDATRLGLRDGELVRVRSRTGTICVPLEIDDRVRPGVVSLPHGYGHDRSGTRLRVAKVAPGASVNDITDAECFDALTGTAAFNGLRVNVEPAVAAVDADTLRGIMATSAVLKVDGSETCQMP
jgi:anaerobic selenocysteine-containing dehydrogenase